MQAIDINSDMIVIDILKLRVQNSVKLDSKHMIARVAVASVIEQAQVLARGRSGKISRPRDDKGDAIATEKGNLRNNTEHKRSREGEGLTGRRLKAQRARIEGMSLNILRAIGQLKKAVGRDRRDSIEAEIRTAEPVEDGSIITT